MDKNTTFSLSCCDDRLVTDFVDKRMTKKEATLYLHKIENCVKVKNCQKCKNLLDAFVLMKQNCHTLKQPLVMPDSLENKLLTRLHEALSPKKSLKF